MTMVDHTRLMNYHEYIGIAKLTIGLDVMEAVCRLLVLNRRRRSQILPGGPKLTVSPSSFSLTSVPVVNNSNRNYSHRVQACHFLTDRNGQQYLYQKIHGFVTVRDVNGSPAFGFTVEVSRSRALMGHLLMRARKFGAASSARAVIAGLEALVAFTRQQRAVLRLYIDVFSRDPGILNAVTNSAPRLGLYKVKRMSSYKDTVVIDLKPEESDIFSSLGRSARRNVRAAGKKGFQICTITDPIYAEKINALEQEAIARTGGQLMKRDWSRIIEFSNRYPELSRMVGCFQPGTPGVSSLVSFVWGCGHGDYATHTIAASTRALESNVPLSYATSWDLIIWCKRMGFTWFDFGGVTPGSLGSSDTLGGISDFKRFFSKQVATVGEEWIFEPHPARGKLARTLSATANWSLRQIYPGVSATRY